MKKNMIQLREKNIIRCDYAWFSLGGEMNSQNNLYWGAAYPSGIHEIPFCERKVGICCELMPPCFVCLSSAFGQELNIFSMWHWYIFITLSKRCSHCESLPPRFTSPKTTITDCYSCIATAGSAVLAACSTVVCRTRRKWSSLYKERGTKNMF